MAITTPQGFDLQNNDPLELKTVKTTLDDRDAISLVTRYDGLKVYVEEDGNNYQLRGGVEDEFWVQFSADMSLYYTILNLQTEGGSEINWLNLTNVPTEFTPTAHTHPLSDVTDIVITSPTIGQIFTFDGSDWVNTDQFVAVWGYITGTLLEQEDLNDALGLKEDLIIPKNSAFNTDFGITFETVARGLHYHYFIDMVDTPPAYTGHAGRIPVINAGETGLEFVEINPEASEATVGIGGDYATIQLALADEKYNILLISDVTETVAWGSYLQTLNNPELFISANTVFSINLSTEMSTGAITLIRIHAVNINFSISSTNNIFGEYAKMFLDNCFITGDDLSFNKFCGNFAHLNGTNLTIDCGVYGIEIHYLQNFNEVTIIGNGAGNFISTQGGTINYLKTSGTFGNSITQDFFIKLNQSILSYVEITHTDAGSVSVYTNSQILKTGVSEVNIMLQAGDGVVIKNCNISYLLSVDNMIAIENNIIANYSYNEIIHPVKNFTHNTITDYLLLLEDNFHMSNCKLNYINVDADNCTIENCECTTGTITVNATADKTIITGCRTVTSIVDNGTNTILLGNLLL